MNHELNATEDALRSCWGGVAEALRQNAHVSDLAVLVLNLRFGQAERLARMLRGHEEVGRKKAGGGSEVLVCCGPRKEVVKAVRMACPDVARRMKRLRVPVGTALVVVPGDGGILGQVVERSAVVDDADRRTR